MSFLVHLLPRIITNKRLYSLVMINKPYFTLKYKVSDVVGTLTAV